MEWLAVVGSVATGSGQISSFSDKSNFVSIYAPGEDVLTPVWNAPGSQGFIYESGTSSGMWNSDIRSETKRANKNHSKC